nr:periplasmic heavy metal sensor [uncultured Desulfobacter sp.]
MKKTLAALTILVVTCTFSAGAFANPPMQGKGKGLKQTTPRACMNLTDEQQKQLSDLHQKFVDDTYETRSSIMNLDQQIRMYMETSDPDPAKLKAMVIEKADLSKDLAVKRLEFSLDARKISPELKFMPMGMGMGSGFSGHGKGYGQDYYGFGNGAGFNDPQDETPPENK